MRVFVLDHDQQPLMPCHPARARALLRRGQAAVFRRYPFTIILKDSTHCEKQPVHLRVDPGSKTTGLALVIEGKTGDRCVWGANLTHRGPQIRDALASRRAIRRSRRQRKTRYRAPRFLNRTRPEGWLPPSLLSRVHNIDTWTQRLCRIAPITAAQVETARFDMQWIDNPEINGVEYQQGTLQDWELREYLLYRHQHTCAYCQGLSGDQMLEKEHIFPKALGGSHRLANLVIACRTCNQAKAHLHPQIWLQQCQDSRSKLNQLRAKHLTNILQGLRPTLKDAAAVNTTRYAVGHAIKALIPLTTAAGVVQGIRYQHCRILHRGDGYGYITQSKIATNHTEGGETRAA